MKRVDKVVAWYQQKIGSYDKQLWEQSVEEAVLKSIDSVPRKTAKVKTDLIDVDLVRGSTFPKAKPQDGNLTVSIHGFLRVVFYPYYMPWWAQQTSKWFSGVLLFLYCLQVGCLVVFYKDGGHQVNSEKLSLAHLYLPVIAMILLGLVHAHIVATYNSHRHRPRTPDSQRKRTRKHLDKSTKLRDLSKEHENEANHHGDVEDSVSPPNTLPRKKKKIRKRSSVPTPLNQDTSLSNSKSRSPQPNLKKVCQLCENALEIDEALKSLERKRSLVLQYVAPDRSETDTYSESGISSIKDIAGNARMRCLHGGNESETTRSENETNLQNNTCQHLKDISCQSGNHLNQGSVTDKANPQEVVASQEFDDAMGIERETNHIVYVSRDGETASCMSGETFESLTQPIPETDGEILMPTSEVLPLQTDRSAVHENTEVKTQYTAGNRTQKQDSQSNGSYNEATQSHKPVKSENHEQNSGVKNTSKTLHITCDNISLSEASKNTCPVNLPLPNDGSNSSEFEELVMAAFDTNIECKDLKLPDPDGELLSCEPHFSGTLEATEITATNLCAPPLETDEDFGHGSDEIHESRKYKVPEKPRFQRPETPSSAESESGTTQTTPKKIDPSETNGVQIQTSELDWDDALNTGDITTDSSTCESETQASDVTRGFQSEQDAFNVHQANSIMHSLATSTDKVSCMVWMRDEVSKVDLSVLDLGWAIIEKADRVPESFDYIWVAVVTTLFLTCIPMVYRVHLNWVQVEQVPLPALNLENITHLLQATPIFLGANWKECVIIINGVLQRFAIAAIFFFLLSVAERTFKQRLIYAKHFCYLTSSRRARKYDMPHFRLNKVRNIKTWLSLRSYLKKRGPQRSVDSIVSAAFLITIILTSLMCVELLHDSEGFLDHLGNWELLGWCLALGFYLLRFMTLGTKINKKYRNFSVLITEQINLYLHMEQKPHKKDELNLAYNVLKLAEALLKELENPFKISGLSINPFLYNCTKVVILSAFSAILTELLGFKLKLYKIKLK